MKITKYRLQRILNNKGKQTRKKYKQTNNDEMIRAELKKKEVNQNNIKNVIDMNNSDLNTLNEEGPEGFGEKMGGKRNSNKSEHFGPRLDYAATIEQSYQNLDNILGGDSIKQLTNDTQKLMAFNVMRITFAYNARKNK